MPDKFPQMLFHPALDPITVKDEIEMQVYLSQGWSMVPIDQTPEGMIRAKIAWHEGEIARLKDLLDGEEPATIPKRGRPKRG